MDGTTQLLESDRRYLVHPLHHPDDHRQPLVVVEGKGAILRDAEGREYIDGLSGLWNVNVGHGRGELADAASAQMRRIEGHAIPCHCESTLLRCHTYGWLAATSLSCAQAIQSLSGEKTRATVENTSLVVVPCNRSTPMMITRIAASMSAYSARP